MTQVWTVELIIGNTIDSKWMRKVFVDILPHMKEGKVPLNTSFHFSASTSFRYWPLIQVCNFDIHTLVLPTSLGGLVVSMLYDADTYPFGRSALLDRSEYLCNHIHLGVMIHS